MPATRHSVRHRLDRQIARRWHGPLLLTAVSVMLAVSHNGMADDTEVASEDARERAQSAPAQPEPRPLRATSAALVIGSADMRLDCDDQPAADGAAREAMCTVSVRQVFDLPQFDMGNTDLRGDIADLPPVTSVAASIEQILNGTGR